MLNGLIGTLTGGTRPSDDLQAWYYTLPSSLLPPLLVSGNQIAYQRNLVFQAAREQNKDFVLFVDSDCVPPRDAVQRLLSHDLPIVSGVCVERTAPFSLCAIKSFEPYQRYQPVDLKGQTEPFPVVAAGTGCLLVRRAVIEAMPSPWFRCGQLSPDLLAEDTDFCLRAAEAGFPVYLDPTVLVGHHVDCLLYPGGDGQLWAHWPGPFGRLPYKEPLGEEVARELHL